MFFSRIRVKPDIRELSHLHHLLHNNGYGVHQLLWDFFPGKAERYLFREEIAREQLRYNKGARGEPIYYMVSHSRPANDSPLFLVDSKPYAPKVGVGEQLAFKLRASPVRLAKKDRPPEDIDGWRKRRTDLGLREKEPTRMRIRHDVVMDTQRQVLLTLSDCLQINNVEGKAAWKLAVFNAWQSFGSQSVTAMLKNYIEENERYKPLLEEEVKPSALFDLAFKAAMDKALEKWLVKKGEDNGFIVAQDEKRNRLRFQAEGYQWHALPKKGRDAGFSSVDFDGVIEVTDPKIFVDKCLFEGIGPEKGFGCGLMLVRRV